MLTQLGGDSFDNATIDDVTRRALYFEPNNGLSLTPTTALAINQSYTIVMLFALGNVSGYRRLFDFKNGTTDNGLYCYNNRLVFKRVNNSYIDSNTLILAPNTFAQLVLTRSAEGDVTAYVNGVRQFFFTDAAGDASVGANNTLRFFRDNDGEASAGVVARLRIYNAPLAGGEIAGLDRLPQAQAGCPSPSGFAQNSGAAGASFLLNGVGLSGVTSVRFPNNLNAVFTSNDDTQLNVTVPAGAVTGTLALSKAGCSEAQTNAVFSVSNATTPALAADYQFQGTLGSAAGFPPVLLNLGGNGFENVEVDGRVRRALKFDPNNGVALFSTAGVVSNQAYTVVALLALSAVSEYRRLLDFKNGTSENGLYCYEGRLVFKRVNNSYLDSNNRVIAANNFVQLAMTRNAAGGVAVYLNGVNQFSFVDANGDALLEGNTLRFFRDNVGDGEASGGYVARLRLFNTALSSNEIAALDRLPTGAVASVSAASFSAAAFAPESIVAAFGSELATATQAAATVPLPTTLAGTRVLVKDSLGIERLAPLFFVAPTQVNYQIPLGTLPGTASVTITGGNGVVSAGTLQILPVAPGLFSANANGQGVPSGVVLRVKADGTQSYEALARFDAAQNRFVAVPIDLGPDLGTASDQVFLVLFGTGIRGRSSLTAVTATLGGANAEVLFADQVAGLVGLDQVNLRVPRSLRGRGDGNLALSAEGRAANGLLVNVK
ncbi:MAG: hypothetical protein HYR56_03750 [Acidobacteria bacterium]|nr:hypothetical protein [Acidobacteriota bacterium]MBI3426846.1 hypothetical protein [Acidobacteriota bacterium]